MYYESDDDEPGELDEFRKQFSVAMDYVVAGLLVLIGLLGFACWLLWRILSEMQG